MNKPSISNDLELAEKALEVMGFTFEAASPKLSCWSNGMAVFNLELHSPISNDLAAEGKRWLEDKGYDWVASGGVGKHAFMVYTREHVLECHADIQAPTENEAVLRAVVEIGTRDN